MLDAESETRVFCYEKKQEAIALFRLLYVNGSLLEKMAFIASPLKLRRSICFNMEKPRVLHLLSNLSLKSGIARVVVNYVKQTHHCIDYTIVYFDDPRGPSYLTFLKNIGVECIYLPRKGFYKRWRRFCNERFGCFDILHNHHPFLSFLLINVKSALGVKRLITHSHVTKHSDSFVKSLRNWFLSIPSSFISDSLFACSTDAGKAIFGESFSKKGFILHNAIVLDNFAFSADNRLKIRKELGLNNEYLIGHIGNFTPQKNHLFLVDVFSEIYKNHDNSRLILVGDGYLRKKVERKVAELRLTEKVFFLGVRDDIGALLSAMDVFVLPSLFEGLGVVLIEAQANGLGCVFSDVVPEEANIFKEFNREVSLKKTPDCWATALSEFKRQRHYDQTLMKNSGYDIFCESKKLIRKYECLIEETQK